jgi:hypothetical protein
MTPRPSIPAATLDALIAAESQPKPERWRNIPNEVREQDLERIRDEELGDPKDLIRRVEDDNRRLSDRELVDRLLANAKARYSAKVARRKPRREELCPRKRRVVERPAKVRTVRPTFWAQLLLNYIQRDGEAGRRGIAA